MKLYRFKPKPYNLTYFIRFLAIATFASHKSTHFNRKPYKMFYIGGFIMKTHFETGSVFLSEVCISHMRYTSKD